MKNQHTPGPWKADIRVAQATVADSHGNAVADIARHEFSVTEQSYSDRRIEANARLISAAPDLLSALREMMAVFQDHEQYDEESAEVVSIARAAIAKAGGAK